MTRATCHVPRAACRRPRPKVIWWQLDVLIERVSSRTTNPYGQTADEQAEIAQYLQTVEPRLRKTATIELDGQVSVGELAGAVEELT